MFSYLAEEVFAHYSADVRELISQVALLDQFTPDLCEALGIPHARQIISDLAREGLFVKRCQDGSLALRR